MPQAVLPFVPHGNTPINSVLNVDSRDGTWTYFHGGLPLFSHPAEDRATFRMFTSQLVCSGQCTQAQITRTFGVSQSSVKRSAKQYREEGCESFYRPRKVRGATVMTAEVLEKSQDLLNTGHTRQEAAAKLGIKAETLRKAIESGKLTDPGRVKKTT
jgi:transposase